MANQFALAPKFIPHSFNGPAVSGAPVYALGAFNSQPQGSFLDRVMSGLVNSTVGAAAGIGSLVGGLAEDAYHGNLDNSSENLGMMKEGFLQTSPLVSLAKGDIGEAASRWWEMPVESTLDLMGAGSLAYKGARRGALNYANATNDGRWLAPFGYKQLNQDFVNNLDKSFGIQGTQGTTWTAIHQLSDKDPVVLKDGTYMPAAQFKGERSRIKDIVELDNSTYARPSRRMVDYTPKFGSSTSPEATKLLTEFYQKNQIPVDRASIEPLAQLGDKFWEIVGPRMKMRTPVFGLKNKIAKGFVNDASAHELRKQHELANINTQIGKLYDEWEKNPALELPSFKRGVTTRDQFVSELGGDPAYQALIHSRFGLGARSVDDAGKIIDGLVRRDMPLDSILGPDGVPMTDQNYVLDVGDLVDELRQSYINGGSDTPSAARAAMQARQQLFGDKTTVTNRELTDLLNSNEKWIRENFLGADIRDNPSAIEAAIRGHGSGWWSFKQPRQVQSPNRRERNRQAAQLRTEYLDTLSKINDADVNGYTGVSAISAETPSRPWGGDELDSLKLLDESRAGSQSVIRVQAHDALSNFARNENSPEAVFDAEREMRILRSKKNWAPTRIKGREKPRMKHPSYVQPLRPAAEHVHRNIMSANIAGTRFSFRMDDPRLADIINDMDNISVGSLIDKLSEHTSIARKTGKGESILSKSQFDAWKKIKKSQDNLDLPASDFFTPGSLKESASIASVVEKTMNELYSKFFIRILDNEEIVSRLPEDLVKKAHDGTLTSGEMRNLIVAIMHTSAKDLDSIFLGGHGKTGVATSKGMKWDPEGENVLPSRNYAKFISKLVNDPNESFQRGVFGLMTDEFHASKLWDKLITEMKDTPHRAIDELILHHPLSQKAFALEVERLNKAYGNKSQEEIRKIIGIRREKLDSVATSYGKMLSEAFSEADHFHEPVNHGRGITVKVGDDGPRIVFHSEPDVVARANAPRDSVDGYGGDTADSSDPNITQDTLMRSPARLAAQHYRYKKYLPGLFENKKVNDLLDAIASAGRTNGKTAVAGRVNMTEADLGVGAARQLRWALGDLPKVLEGVKGEEALTYMVDKFNKEMGTNILPSDINFIPMKFPSSPALARDIERRQRNLPMGAFQHGLGEHGIGDPYYMYATGNWDASHGSVWRDLEYNTAVAIDRDGNNLLKDLGPKRTFEEIEELEKGLGERIPLHDDLRKSSMGTFFVAVPDDAKLFVNEDVSLLKMRRNAKSGKYDDSPRFKRAVLDETDGYGKYDKMLTSKDGEYYSDTQLEQLVRKHRRKDKYSVIPRDLYDRLLYEAGATNTLLHDVAHTTGKYGKHMMLHWRFPGWVRNNTAGSFGLLTLAHPKYVLELARTIPGLSKFDKDYYNYMKVRGARVTDLGTSYMARTEDLMQGGLPNGVTAGSRYSRFIASISRWNSLIADQPFRMARLHGAINEIAEHIMSKNGGKLPEGVRTKEDLWRMVADDPSLRMYAIDRTLGDMINFGDMTRREREWVGVFLPFYSWLKGSFKLGNKLLVEKPETLALMSNLSELGISKLEQEYGEFIPEYLKGAMLVPGMQDVVANFAGMNPLETPADLYTMGASHLPLPKAAGGASYRRYGSENLLNSIHPLLRTGVGAMTGRDLFTGTPLPRDEGAGWSMAKGLAGMVPPFRLMQPYIGGAKNDPAKITPLDIRYGSSRWLLGSPLQPINSGMLWQRGLEERQERGVA